MAVVDDFVWAIAYRPRPGMWRMYQECRSAWGNPNRDGHSWPEAVLSLVCESIRYKWSY